MAEGGLGKQFQRGIVHHFAAGVAFLQNAAMTVRSVFCLLYTSISNYLTFQSAYSELYFTSTYWPDFTPEALHRALVEYAGRNRRFGLTQEQIQ